MPTWEFRIEKLHLFCPAEARIKYILEIPVGAPKRGQQSENN